jgi:3-deoxy-D-manno-octulosonic-acid transferase
MIWRTLDLLHALFVVLFWPVRWTKWGRKRVAFERARDPALKDAQWTFEVSSEGEFEQIRPWLEMLLLDSQNIELVFASESVLKTVKDFKKRYSSQVRLFPLPLLTHTPWELVRRLKARRLVLCRYDFFPSLMARSTVSTVHAGVVWASFTGKRERLKKRFWREFYRWLYSSFRWVVPATHGDELIFHNLCSLKVFPTNEMRVPQILKRLSQGEQTLKNKFPHWEKFQAHMQKYSPSSRWMLGSFWEPDLAFLNNETLRADIKSEKTLVLLVPHQLGTHWREKISVPVTEITPEWAGEIISGSVILLNLKGVLCELYSHAGHVYVGGGFGRSVHSVMEPFVAGARVYCGPKIQRSTEVEAIIDLGGENLKVVAEYSRLAHCYSERFEKPQDLTRRQEWLDNQVIRLCLNLAEVKQLC